MKMDLLKRNAFLALLTASIVVGVATSAQAQQVDFDSEMDKIDAVVVSLAGMVVAFTDVVIMPMGISSAVRTFRHVVLNNV